MPRRLPSFLVALSVPLALALGCESSPGASDAGAIDAGMLEPDSGLDGPLSDTGSADPAAAAPGDAWSPSENAGAIDVLAPPADVVADQATASPDAPAPPPDAPAPPALAAVPGGTTVIDFPSPQSRVRISMRIDFDRYTQTTLPESGPYLLALGTSENRFLSTVIYTPATPNRSKLHGTFWRSDGLISFSTTTARSLPARISCGSIGAAPLRSVPPTARSSLSWTTRAAWSNQMWPGPGRPAPRRCLGSRLASWPASASASFASTTSR